MNEVDKIITKSLQNIHIDLNGVESLNEFLPDLIAVAISACLSYINQSTTMCSSYPEIINERYKICNRLVTECKKLGYTGVLGCETIMYKQINDVRNLFIFLIEKFPKITKNTQPKPNSQILLSLKIGLKIKEALNSQYFPYYKWIPYNTKECSTYCLQLHEKSTVENQFIPAIIKQCSNSNLSLISSIIDWNSSRIYIKQKKLKISLDSKENCCNLLAKYFTSSSLNKNTDDFQLKVNLLNIENMNVNETDNKKIKNEDIVNNENEETIKVKIEKLKRRIQKIMTSINDLTIKLNESVVNKENLIRQIEALNDDKKILTDDLKIYGTLKILLTDPDKYQQLLETLSKTQESMKLDDENYNKLKTNINQEIELLEKPCFGLRDQITTISKEIETMEHEFTALSIKVQDLSNTISQMEQLPNSEFSRTGFTSRIFEITENIRSHRLKIQQVLIDITKIYKEALELNDSIIKTFKECNSMILKDAAIDTFFKNSYMSISKITLNFERIIESIQKRSTIVQCSRELEDSIAAVDEKELDANLEKLTHDFQQLVKQ